MLADLRHTKTNTLGYYDLCMYLERNTQTLHTLYKNTYANPTLYFNNQAGYSQLANNANKAKILQQSTTQDCKLVTHFLLDRDQTTMIETKIKTFAEDLHDLQLK